MRFQIKCYVPLRAWAFAGALLLLHTFVNCARGATDTDLPPSGDLERVLPVPGVPVTVHFSSKTADSIPDEKYATDVATFLCEAFDRFAMDGFKRPRPAGPDGTFHIYFRLVFPGEEKLINGSGAQAKGEPNGDGTYRSYFYFKPDLRTRSQGRYATRLKSLCFHEAMHAVQYMYAGVADSSWFDEAVAVWAQKVYANDSVTLKEFLGEEDSVLNSPELPLWYFSDGSYHAYSAAAFILALQPGLPDAKIGFSSNLILNLYENIQSQTTGRHDAIAAILDLFGRDQGKFGSFYRSYLRNLALGGVSGYDSKKLGAINPVKIEDTIKTVGWTASPDVIPTGARFYAIAINKDDPSVMKIPNRDALISMDPSDQKPEALLITRAYGALDEQLLQASGTISMAGWKSDKAILIVTDTSCTNEAPPVTSLTFDVQSPFLEFVGSTPQTPLKLGQSETINITYNTLGVSPRATFLPTDYSFENAGPLLQLPADGVYNLPTGMGKMFPLTLTTHGNQTGTAETTFNLVFPAPSVYSGLNDYSTVSLPISIQIYR